MYTVGIDIGTSKLCAVKYNIESGAVEKTVSASNSFDIASDILFERIQNPADIFNAVVSLLDEIGTEDVRGIGISNQMHGIVYYDKCGIAVSPLYTWQDMRGNERYHDGCSYADVFGAPAGYGLTTDFYNETNGIIPEKTVGLCSIGDYIVMRLCGKSEPLTHITNAASFGCFDVVQNCFTSDNPRLPEVTADFAVAGEYGNIPVTVAVGDNQASFIGSVDSDDDILINIGTGSQVSYLSDNPVASDQAETRPFDGKRYLIACCALCGGSAFADAVDFVRDCAALVSDIENKDIYPAVDRLLDGYDGERLFVDTRFCGTRNDPGICGSINGITERNFTPAAFLSGVCDGIARELYEMLHSCDPAFFAVPRVFVGSGGGIRKNHALRRAVEKVFNSTLHYTSFNEEAAVGVALIANNNIIN